MKDTICTAIGIIGGVIASLFGGWDTALQTLVIFMAIDYITGLVVAGVFHASPKTKTGALESKAGWKGLIRKGETLLIVLVACQLDAVIGGSFVRDAAIIGFSANEAISIVENAGLMGLPIPAAITKAIDIITGLRQGLDEEKAEDKDAMQQLDSLYEYMTVRLTQANAANDPELIDEVARLLITVKSGWDAIAPQ